MKRVSFLRGVLFAVPGFFLARSLESKCDEFEALLHEYDWDNRESPHLGRDVGQVSREFHGKLREFFEKTS